MSRRNLLTSRGGSGAIPDPGDGGGGGPDPDPDPPVDPPGTLWAGWPTSDDPNLLSFRPHGRRAGYASVNVTGATHGTLGPATVASKVQAADLGRDGALSWDGLGPDYRSDTIIGPATYPGGGGGGDWACYVGSTGDPDDVILAGGGTAGGVIHSFGSLYLEGLTLRTTIDGDGNSPKYPWHITSGPVTIAQNCVFDIRESNPALTAGLVGKDASIITVFYNCTFIANPDQNPFNMHGQSYQDKWPEVGMFINCDFQGVAWVGTSGAASATGEPPEMYFIGCTYDEHLDHIAVDQYTVVYTDSDLPVTGDPLAVHRDVTTWPEFENGLPTYLNDHYYPSALGDGAPRVYPAATVTDAAVMVPVVGRKYITRVSLTEAARIQRLRYTTPVAGSTVYVNVASPDNEYTRDNPPSASLFGYDTTLTSPTTTWQHYYAATRYPGDNGFFVEIRFTDAAARVVGSAQLPGLTDCWYTDDGTILVPVTAGTPHPLPSILTKN